MCTESIHKALVDKGLPPREHLVDAGYVSAELLVCSQVHYGIDLVGPARVNATWQTKVEGAYTGERGVAIFAIDFSGRPARKISKNHATANAFGCPDSSCFARFDPTRGRNIATQ